MSSVNNLSYCCKSETIDINLSAAVEYLIYLVGVASITRTNGQNLLKWTDKQILEMDSGIVTSEESYKENFKNTRGSQY